MVRIVSGDKLVRRVFLRAGDRVAALGLQRLLGRLADARRNRVDGQLVGRREHDVGVELPHQAGLVVLQDQVVLAIVAVGAGADFHFGFEYVSVALEAVRVVSGRLFVPVERRVLGRPVVCCVRGPIASPAARTCRS